MLASQQARALRPAAAKAVGHANRTRFVRSVPQIVPGHSAGARQNRAVMLKAAAKEEVDFDKILIQLATKWEESDNKPVVVGYSAAFVLGFFLIEWFIHLPGMNYLLGFPIQLVGVAALPWLLVRWIVDKKDWYDDVSSATGYVVSKLPYLEKEKK